MQKRCGGGILPFAIHNDKVYFLFSRERLVFNKHRDRGLYSDFGGSQEKNESDATPVNSIFSQKQTKTTTKKK